MTTSIYPQIRTHWGYFLTLEEDAERLSRYIEFSKSNLKTFSIEIARLLMASASEVDVVARQICEAIDPSTKVDDIKSYAKIIIPQFPHITNIQVELPRFELVLTPWAGWSINSPDWWKSNNKIKHSRHDNFEKANLENFLNALTGLFTLLLLLFKPEAEKGLLVPNPRLLVPGPPYKLDYLFWGEDRTRTYKL